MEDRISSLPSNIIGIILMDLPLKDAVRSSILSSKWRYEWSTIPQLVFDRHSFPLPSRHALGEIVDQVLFLHSGPIEKFAFDGYTYDDSFTRVDRWLVYLSRNGLKELILNFCPTRLYQLPTTLFNCQALTFLELQDCEFILPCVSKGFINLATLVLKDITISDEYFESLISNCPLLRKLVFSDFYGCSHLKVNAPNLKELFVNGFFEDIDLENTPLLATLSVGLEDGEEEDHDNEEDFEDEFVQNGEYHNFKKSLSGVLKIERLELQTNMFEFLAKGSILEKLPTYNYLTKLYLSMVNFKDLRHNLMICCFFRSSPVLRELEIEADSDDSMAIAPAESFCNGNGCLDFKFNNLRTMKMVEICGEKPELDFIKFVLANAPVLETLNIRVISDPHEDARIFKEIMRFRRASTQAEIICLD
ncbi:RNI-like protein [Dioscorea alata]|uniref:RNI-like protein n=7 Tax=Dioscorea alata TaxID=55571 RepID=A0ACB7UGD4_DIOAL|nr:RNI-like protein [Dioscorea alata]KAH7659296.1 RNI-like protein [Dioscorea alata]KAH7659297.1 RNI-like protein [Dioscorea alata]KAH7659298.1 RNI-like protein [Dioscorea alata]KAH7659299.1 RNI-like protein [Dioscorea alata]